MVPDVSDASSGMSCEEAGTVAVETVVAIETCDNETCGVGGGLVADDGLLVEADAFLVGVDIGVLPYSRFFLT